MKPCTNVNSGYNHSPLWALVSSFTKQVGFDKTISEGLLKTLSLLFHDSSVINFNKFYQWNLDQTSQFWVWGAFGGLFGFFLQKTEKDL